MDICTVSYWILYSVESMRIDCEPEYNDTLVHVHLFRHWFRLLKDWRHSWYLSKHFHTFRAITIQQEKVHMVKPIAVFGNTQWHDHVAFWIMI